MKYYERRSKIHHHPNISLLAFALFILVIGFCLSKNTNESCLSFLNQSGLLSLIKQLNNERLLANPFVLLPSVKWLSDGTHLVCNQRQRPCCQIKNESCQKFLFSIELLYRKMQCFFFRRSRPQLHSDPVTLRQHLTKSYKSSRSQSGIF